MLLVLLRNDNKQLIDTKSMRFLYFRQSTVDILSKIRV